MYAMKLIRCCCNDLKRFALVSDHSRKNVFRSISVSASNYLKEIHRAETENQIVVEGVKIKSDREGRVINNASLQGCPLCKLGLKNLRHTDILILSQFINSDGSIINQNVTGLCNKQHFRVVRAVGLAQKAGLIPKKPGTPMFGDWEKYNTYFKKF
ncbi:39S ribosomal protein S18a, mitochondrial-like [Uloborus diversus]|uniref:39S ribosomal protein S18a, mitochondrial-like n=1 Tax=Uloborus diversus TaxID=327109 RepID=UPI0024093957|nr:39S ribosomal protein S18a, mitochondrial-like [Uloborus diversus]